MTTLRAICSKKLSKEEIEFFKFIRLLTEESRERFYTLMFQYVFKIKNSESFNTHCERQDKSGFNSFAIWLKKHNFKPVFR
jgi:hypothetical protein